MVNYFEVHKLDVSWKPFLVREKGVGYMDRKDFTFIIYPFGSLFFSADCTFYDTVC